MGFQNPHFCISTPENPSEMKSADLTVRRCMRMYVCMYVKKATPLDENGFAGNPHHEVAVTSWGCNNIKMLQHQLDVAERCWCMHVCMYVCMCGHTCIHHQDTVTYIHTYITKRRLHTHMHTPHRYMCTYILACRPSAKHPKIKFWYPHQISRRRWSFKHDFGHL